MDIEPRAEYDISDIGQGVWYALIVPVGSPRILECIDPGNSVIDNTVSSPFIIAGVDYTAQAASFAAGGSFKARIV
jgi:hypothetical protein